MAQRLDLVGEFAVNRGATYPMTLLWAQPTLTSIPITGVSKAARAVVTATGHGLPSGEWCVYVRGVGGMTKLNHKPDDVGNVDAAYLATKLTADTVRLNVDTLDMTTYSSGGELLFRSPVDLTGYTAKMQVRRTARAADPPIVEVLSTGIAPASRITLSLGTVYVELSAADTALIDSPSVYAIEMTEVATGVVTRLVEGIIRTTAEVVRNA